MQIHLTSIPTFDDASCKDIAFPDAFFPTSQKDIDEFAPIVSRICGSCPNKNACLQFAIDEDIRHGIWGGMLPDEREKFTASIRRRRSTRNVIARVGRVKSNTNTTQQLGD